MGVCGEGHRRRVTGLACDLDDRRSFQEQERHEGVTEVIGPRVRAQPGVGRRGREHAPAPVSPGHVAPGRAVSVGKHGRAVHGSALREAPLVEIRGQRRKVLALLQGVRRDEPALAEALTVEVVTLGRRAELAPQIRRSSCACALSTSPAAETFAPPRDRASLARFRPRRRSAAVRWEDTQAKAGARRPEPVDHDRLPRVPRGRSADFGRGIDHQAGGLARRSGVGFR
jgi:hypothetical protein